MNNKADAEKWIEAQFHNRILPHCNLNRQQEAFAETQRVFLECVKMGWEPRLCAEILRGKLMMVKEVRTQAKQLTGATEQAIEYLKLMLEEEIPKGEYRAPNKVLVVKGDSETLKAISNGGSFYRLGDQVVSHGDPSDVKMTDEQMNDMLRGKTISFGTTRLEIRHSGDQEKLKRAILQKYPTVTFPSDNS